MRDFWKKYKLWISICIYLALIVLIFIFAVRPLLSSIKEISNETQKMKVDEEINRSKIAKMSDITEIHTLIEEQKDSFEIMIDSSQEVEFIKKLEELAESTGNEIEITIDESSAGQSPNKNVKNSKAKPADDIISLLPYDKYLLIQLNLEGNYQSLTEFIYKLENFDYYVNVLSISMAKDIREESQEINKNIFAPPNTSNEKNSNDRKNILRSSINLAAYIKQK